MNRVVVIKKENKKRIYIEDIYGPDIINIVTNLRTKGIEEGPDYDFEIFNDIPYSEKDVLSLRSLRYPNMIEILEALIDDSDGLPDKLIKIKEKRAKVKIDIPKQ